MRIAGIADAAWVQSRPASARAGGPGDAPPRGPVPSLPLYPAGRSRFTAEGLASLIAQMGGGDDASGAGWFVSVRV